MERCRIHKYRGPLKKKIAFLICILVGLSAGCTHNAGQSEWAEYYRQLPDIGKKEATGLFSLTRPVPDSVLTKSAEIDSVRKVVYKKGLALLIYGELPNPCCHLYMASTRIQDDTLFITVSTWQQPADSVCSGRPVPFTYANTDLTTAEFKAVKIYKAGTTFHRFRY